MHKELIEKLFEKATGKSFPTGVDSIHPNEVQRFAELIVGEVGEILSKRYAVAPDTHLLGLYDAMNLLDAHFDFGDESAGTEMAVELVRYQYRGLPFLKDGVDHMPFSIAGQDTLNGGSGVLEWCTDKEDADAMLAKMQKYPQFVDIKIREERWE